MKNKINDYFESALNGAESTKEYTDEELQVFVAVNIGIVATAAMTVLALTSSFY